MPGGLHFTDYCDEYGLDYFDPTPRDRYDAFCRHDPANDPPPLPPPPAEEWAAWRLWCHEQFVSERREMRRRSGRPPVYFIRFYKLVSHGEPLRIVRNK